MTSERCLLVCQIVAWCAGTITAAAGFGVYYFEKRVEDEEKNTARIAEEIRVAEAKKKEAEETNVGRLIAKVKSRTTDAAVLEIGNSGTFFRAPSTSGIPILDFSLKFAPGTNFKVVLKDNQMKISIILRNSKGEVVAELDKNEWMINPHRWDRNYTQDILEVKDSEGQIVLQVHALPDRIRMHAKFYDENGQGLIFTTGPKGAGHGAYIVVTGKNVPWSSVTFNPLFRYPSKLHLGELIR